MTDYIRQLEQPRFPSEASESKRVIASFESDAAVSDGVVRWKSNNSVPPQDVLDLWTHVGKPFDADLSKRTRDAETAVFLAAYIKADRDRKPDPEELFEMRAAFGEGVEVVDVISRRKFKL